MVAPSFPPLHGEATLEDLMVITAKFASSCPKCGQPISVGSKVEWNKGSRAAHVSCGASASRAKSVPAPRRTERKPAIRRAPKDGETVIQRRSDGRGDGYEVGATLYLTRTTEYVTIVSAWQAPPDEDIGQYDWACCAIVRPATDSERAECAARRAAQQTRAALAAIPTWLVRQVQDAAHLVVNSVPVPADAWRLTVGSRLAGSETLYVGDGAVYYMTSSYDDGPRTWRMPVTAEQIAALSTAIEVLS